MHEVSLACSVLQIVEETAARERFQRVVELRLAVGPLSGVEVEALRFALECIAPGTFLEGARLVIEEPPGEAWCVSCTKQVTITHRSSPCPHCGGYQLHPTGGTDLRILEMLVRDD